MGGGTVWRSVVRAVGAAAAPTVAVSAGAAHCAACSAASTSSPRARAVSCSCKATGAAQAHPLTAVSYGPGQFWDLDDWEIAGDEERDHCVFGSLPTVKEVEEASSDLQNALRLGFFTPRVPKPEALPKPESSLERSPSSPRGPTIVDVTEVSTVTTVGDVEDEVTSDLSAPNSAEVEAEAWLEPPPHEVAAGPKDPAPMSAEADSWLEPPSYEVATSPKAPEAPSSAMLEAFHQFQHNPQVQGMVVSLATDKGVWDAVLANAKIKEFRRNFSAPTSEEGAMDQKVKGSRKNSNVFSRFFWKSKKAFANFISNFQDFVMALFETAEKNGPGSSDNEKTNFFERSVKACMMLAVLVLAIVLFKRSAFVKRG